MQIQENSAVTFNYELSDEQGKVLENSTNYEPVAYVQGEGKILSGLEKALLGREIGDKFEVTLTAEDGYGLHNEEGIAVVDRAVFADQELVVGMHYQMHDEEDGDEQMMHIVGLTDTDVTLDANHPYAGKTLTFKIEVLTIEAAK